MMSGEPQRAGQPQPGRWREILGEFPAIRQVFHALCALGEGEDATEVLGFAARQEWMAVLARRAGSVARLDDTVPFEPGDEDLLETLWELYAASRVRDVLLLAHQPGPVARSANWTRPSAASSPVSGASPWIRSRSSSPSSAASR